MDFTVLEFPGIMRETEAIAPSGNKRQDVSSSIQADWFKKQNTVIECMLVHAFLFTYN